MTTNQPATIEADTFTVSRSIHIAAPADKVWAAVTEPEHISRWFGTADFAGTTPGSLGTLNFGEGQKIPLRIESVDPMRSVSYRWSNDDALGARPEAFDEEHSTVFTFTLDPVDGGTRLTVVETGFDQLSDPAADMASHGEGWTIELDKLVAVLEGAA